MSLVTAASMFVGHDQCSVAALSADGVRYVCYVWLNRTRWTVDTACFRVLPSGAVSLVFANSVASATSSEVTATSGIPLDCPRIMAVGTTFVVHWLQATTISGSPPYRNWSLYRSTMDMEAFDTTAWTARGSVGLLASHALYDAVPVIGSDTDMVVVRYTSGPVITVQRFNGFDWIDTEWTTTPSTTIDARVLSAYAHDGDDDVLVCYQLTSDGLLYTRPFNATDGTAATAVRSFTAIPACDVVQARFCRIYSSAHQVVLAIEFRTDANATTGADLALVSHLWIHHVAFRRLHSTTAIRLGNEHWAGHLALVSDPWSTPNGVAVAGTASDVYVTLARKSVVEPHDWVGPATFVCNLDLALWDSVSSGAGLRPRPIVTSCSNGVADARPAGWHPESSDIHAGGPARRMNHVSAAVLRELEGPDARTWVVAVTLFAGYRTTGFHVLDEEEVELSSGTALQPDRAEVNGLVIYLEDPWTVYRSTDDEEQPVDNFTGGRASAMLQTAPCGHSIMIAGGTPYLYDGRATVECGYFWPPEIFAQQSFDDGVYSNTAELTLEGTYQWYACWSWPDAQGQLHRSGPSNILTVDHAGTDHQLTILRLTAMTLSLRDATAHYADAPKIQIELYRTTAGGTIFYPVFGKLEPEVAGTNYRVRDLPTNDPTADYIDIRDGLSDAELVLHGVGPYQYDANGVLAGPLPQIVPGFSVIASHANRAWGVDALDPRRVWYSDEVLPDFGGDYYLAPVFNDAMTFLSDSPEPIVGLCGMNNAMILFTLRTITSLTFRDAGSGLLDIASEILHSDCGCIEPRSIVLGPQGIFFQSAKGLMLLDRSRALSFAAAGASVEDDIASGGNIRSAVVMEDRQQLRVTTNGRPAVYQSHTLTIGNVNDAGTWTITGLAADVEVEAGIGDTATQIAAALEDVVNDLIAAQAPDDTLRFQVESASAVGSSLTLNLLADIDLTIAGDGPGTGTVTVATTTTIETRPRVLVGDLLYTPIRWSRADLVQTSSTTRLAELVGGCSWRDGSPQGSLHVALAQGAVLIERAIGESAQYGDDTAVATVGVPIDVQLSWLHPAGGHGASMLYELAIQTERINDAQIFAELEYDIGGAHDGQQLPVSSYEWPNGSDPTPADLRVFPLIQGARAFHLRIYEDSGVTTDETVRLVGLSLHAGLLPGTARVRPDQRGST